MRSKNCHSLFFYLEVEVTFLFDLNLIKPSKMRIKKIFIILNILWFTIIHYAIISFGIIDLFFSG